MRARLAGAFLTGALVIAAGWGCYGPTPADGSFKCSPDLGGLCPAGLVCSIQGFCVQNANADSGGAPLDLAGDQATLPVSRTCDDRVMAGAFSNLTPLTAANTSDDETHIALDPTGTMPRLLFVRSNVLYQAAISTSNPKVVSAPQAVTLTPAPTSLYGGSFTSDGKYWFAGSNGAGTSLYAATPAGNAAFTVGAAHAPTTQGCAFADPWFMQGDATYQMYAAFSLGGCAGDSYVVRSALDRNAGAFYSALPESGWAAPSMTSSGLLLLVSSTVGGQHIYGATRTDYQYLFTSAGRIPMTSIGEATADLQAVVSADCHTIYFSSIRAGGAGGADLYAADIATE